MAKSTKQTSGPYISTVDAARMLSISVDTLHLLTIRGVVKPARMMKGEFLFRQGDIEKRIFQAHVRREPL